MKPSGTDAEIHEKYLSTVNLLVGVSKQKWAEMLSRLLDKLQKEYEETRTKGNKKYDKWSPTNEVEEIENDTQFTWKKMRKQKKWCTY